MQEYEWPDGRVEVGGADYDMWKTIGEGLNFNFRYWEFISIVHIFFESFIFCTFNHVNHIKRTGIYLPSKG